MIGLVSSNKMTGTVSVKVEMFKIHPIYKKRLKRSKKFLAATSEKLSTGDRVEIKKSDQSAKTLLSRWSRYLIERRSYRQSAQPLMGPKIKTRKLSNKMVQIRTKLAVADNPSQKISR